MVQARGPHRFVCEACHLIYPSRSLAQQCETYCTTKKACNIDITKHAIRDS
ncbi:hypothetical protein HY641_01185 [Candidatus Woesearchaeota archaeon]|nr:hypothetical protein [Candidatus Woesearchaeota archaeon]